jgi:sulfhydrogenase subunit beta (sulfur reductase)
MKAIAKTALPDLFAALQGRVYVPVRDGKGFSFGLWEGQPWPDDYQNAIVPPKHILFPQTEDLYTFRMEGEDMAIDPVAVPEETSFIFGLRPCDCRAIELLDLVFREGPFVDAAYNKRRENTLLMVLGCKEGVPTCFCTSFGLEPAFAPGADWNMWDLGEVLVVEPGTDKGKELLDSLGLFREATDEEKSQVEKLREEAKGTITLHAPTEGITELLQANFDHPLWDEISRKCLECGACTYLCPTCHCYDMQSSSVLGQGRRFRCWDSCMYCNYTLMAGGHNPRPSKRERVRNRFLHKLQYFPENQGEFGCVGCGRCLINCPVCMDITRFMAQAKEVMAK